MIALVALIVIGPEKLPKVARTLGLLAGRMQRYANSIKEDVNRELQADELRNLQQEVQQSIKSVEQHLETEVKEIEHTIHTATTDVVSETPKSLT